MKINELKPYMKKVNLKFKVIELTEIRSVKSMLDQIEHKVCEAKIADETASIYLTLWDKAIQEIQPEKNYSLENGFTSEFKKSLRVNIGRFGKITPIQEEIQSNTEKMMSTPITPKTEKTQKPQENTEVQEEKESSEVQEKKESNEIQGKEEKESI